MARGDPDSESDPKSAPPEHPGERIGRYRVEALLGVGGMGRVVRAWDEVLRRRVAIKVLSADGDGKSTVRRILREARLAAALDHPGAVAIFDFGEHEGAPFIVMEHVSGASLRAQVGRADVSPATRLGWLVDVARALSAAHREGIVHRDVKPENVMVRDDGAVKVLDFGIARRAGEAVAPGGPALPSGEAPSLDTIDQGAFSGTPAYMAPELLLTGRLDARADQFAWGVMAYELLAGALPWRDTGDLRALLTAVIYVEPAPLEAEALGVPAEAARAVHRALQKDPEARFPSMDALLAALGAPAQAIAASPGAPGSSEIATLPTEKVPAALGDAAGTLLQRAPLPGALGVTETPRSSRRRRAALALAALLVVGAGAVAIARRAVAPRGSPVPSFQPRNIRRLTFDQGCQEYPSFGRDGRELFFDATAGPDSHVFALDLVTGNRRAITSEPGWQYAPNVSPDGRLVAFMRREGDRTGAYVVPVDGSAPSRLLSEGWVHPSFSPDGRAVWAGSGSTASRLDLVTSAVTRTLRAPAGQILSNLVELDDGRVLGRFRPASREALHGVAIYARGQDAEPRWLTRERIEDALLVTPDGRSVIVARTSAARQTELALYPLDGGPPVPLPGAGIAPPGGLTLSRARDRAAWSTCGDHTDMVALSRRPDGRFASELLAVASEDDRAPAWIPGGTRLAVVSNRAGEVGLWVIDRADREPPRRIPVGAVRPESPATSPDGAWIAFRVEGEGLYLVPTDGSAAPRRLTRGASDRGPCFSADGATIYFQAEAEGGRPRVDAVPVAGGAPATILAGASLPATATGADVLAYLARDGADEAGVPMILDRSTGRATPVSPSLPRAQYTQIRLSRGATHVTVVPGRTEVIEIDRPTGAVVARYASGNAELWGVTYMDDELIAVREVWAGSLWIGDDPLR
jgi:serine/threonine-protein kinase